MTNRKTRSRITVAGSHLGMVCKPKQASHLLQGLWKEYQLLTPEEQNQVRSFILGFHLNGSSRHNNPNMLKSEVEH